MTYQTNLLISQPRSSVILQGARSYLDKSEKFLKYAIRIGVVLEGLGSYYKQNTNFKFQNSNFRWIIKKFKKEAMSSVVS